MLRTTVAQARLTARRGYASASPAKILVGLNVRADRFDGDQKALVQELSVNSDLGEQDTDAIVAKYQQQTKTNAAKPIAQETAEGHARQWIALLDDIKAKSMSSEKFEGKDALDMQKFRETLEQYRQDGTVSGFFSEVAANKVNPMALIDPTSESQFEQVITGKNGKKALFVPTEEQVAEAQALADAPLPNKHESEFETHLINMIMRNGRKTTARKYFYQAVELAQVILKQDPIPLLKKVFDEVAPVCVTKAIPVGARKVHFPVPITERQRRRMAWMWSIDNANKRPNREFPVRLGEEIASVIKSNGSSLMEKTLVIHNLAVANRVHVAQRARK
ncbi:37S ribosomal protein S7 [Yarrowia sp. C11]|nr:37S ribosomal protein S7 [Yarrowia sp. E02]KAG5369297.1 37S ribosomal protein S7 [Yarrowia sp. C11]